ncbi:hypothetical protein WICMUC_003478 [Wickerhamomyces mucosus]|uniref:Arf3-interacting protein 1 N-terminal domain-containing protein n=1 Tax=Wickerhamomyces mucosus TaxID=1378264 RepID=A0A9P8TCM5_9ASCO|nr:hypothetical protein WICMUC_003478 [Wickerhamomyces mucosus]
MIKIMNDIQSQVLIRHTQSSNNNNDYIKFIIGTEFDHKIGPIIKHQIPHEIPGFKDNLNTLADLFIPDNSEQSLIEDYSIQILYKDLSDGNYKILPSSDFQNDNDGNIDSEILIFYTVTKSIKSNNSKRGLIIKSISIGTLINWDFIINLKPILKELIDIYLIDESINLIQQLEEINYKFKNYSSSSNHFQIDQSIISKLLKFLIEILTNLNNLNNLQNLSIFIYSQNSTDYLSQFIIILSQFLNGFQTFNFINSKILYFPLIELINFEKFIMNNDNKGSNFKILGIRNLIFKDFIQYYDFFYDLDSNQLIINNSILQREQEPPIVYKNYEILSILQKIQSSNNLNEFTIDSLIKIFQKFNIYKILNFNDCIDSIQFNLKFYYLKNFNNLIIFEKFFHKNSIILIKLIKNLLICIDNNQILKLNDIYKELNQSIQLFNDINLFITILKNFPIQIISTNFQLYELINFKNFNDEFEIFNLILKPIFYKSKIPQLIKFYQNLNPFIKINEFLTIAIENKEIYNSI